MQHCNIILYAVYVVAAAGNSGNGGLHTPLSPSTLENAMAVASVDNTFTLTAYTIFTPNGSKILYIAGAIFGGWRSTLNAVIVVNSQFTLYQCVESFFHDIQIILQITTMVARHHRKTSEEL